MRVKKRLKKKLRETKKDPRVPENDAKKKELLKKEKKMASAWGETTKDKSRSRRGKPATVWVRL